jgi:RNA polymerase sigma-70 factor (ECF subfamily)
MAVIEATTATMRSRSPGRKEAAPDGSGNWLSDRQRHLASLCESEDCEVGRHFGERQMHSVREEKPHNPDSSSLSDVIELAQRGDVGAFELIYRLHCRRVYTLCLRMVKDPSEAEDLTQEAFMQLFRKIHTFRGEAAFSSWLHRLTANIVLMRLRKRKPISTSLDQIFAGDDGDQRPHNEAGRPDLRLTGIFDRVNLQRAVDQLPRGYKTMFILHDVHGYEHSEIAKILGCSVGTSKSQLHKARKQIREFLRGAQHYSGQATLNA